MRHVTHKHHLLDNCANVTNGCGVEFTNLKVLNQVEEAAEWFKNACNNHDLVRVALC